MKCSKPARISIPDNFSEYKPSRLVLGACSDGRHAMRRFTSIFTSLFLSLVPSVRIALQPFPAAAQSASENVAWSQDDREWYYHFSQDSAVLSGRKAKLSDTCVTPQSDNSSLSITCLLPTGFSWETQLLWARWSAHRWLGPSLLSRKRVRA